MASSDGQIEARAVRAAADWHAVWLLGLGLCAALWPASPGSDLRFALGAAGRAGPGGPAVALAPGGRSPRR
ncbi:MAG: hypothetical protein WDM85_04375 [Caulobacteraceae bacterium]